MSKSVYSYIGDTWNRPLDDDTKELYRQRLIEWRKGPTFQRVEKPLRLDKARMLGYRAKPGFIVVRAKVRKGSFRKRGINKGRRAKRKGETRLKVRKNTRQMAEERTQKRYPNLEVLNYYPVGEDGKQKYFEVILVDPHHPAIINDPKISWIQGRQHTRRAYRGLTSAGKKNRGLRKKGKGSEKSRPSRSAHEHKKRPGKKIRFP
jgi:large subunit ribosomal protein L15e